MQRDVDDVHAYSNDITMQRVLLLLVAITDNGRHVISYQCTVLKEEKVASLYWERINNLPPPPLTDYNK